MNKIMTISSLPSSAVAVPLTPILFAGDPKQLYFAGNDQGNTLYGNDLGNRMDGFGGDDHLYGGKGYDSLYGGDGNDYLSGGAGMDVLHGGSGNDRLSGGSGFDMLYGESGQDTMTGGADADLFFFEAPNDSYYKTGSADVITDFSISERDHVIVPSYIDTTDTIYMTNSVVHDIETAHTLARAQSLLLGTHPDTAIVANPNGDAYVFINLGFDPYHSYASGIVLQNAGAEVAAHPALVLDHSWGF